MKLRSIESYWSEELGESVEIIPVGWNEWPSEYALHLGGTNVASFRLLEDLEDYLSRYFVLKGGLMDPYTTDEILSDLVDLEVTREFERRGNIILEDEAAEIGKRVGIRFLGWLNTLKVAP